MTEIKLYSKLTKTQISDKISIFILLERFSPLDTYIYNIKCFIMFYYLEDSSHKKHFNAENFFYFLKFLSESIS